MRAAAVIRPIGIGTPRPADLRLGLDIGPFWEQDFFMSSAAVRKLISLAAELSEDERRIVVDAIAPKASIASLAEEWESEIARRAERVRSGNAQGKPADDVFGRLCQ